MTSLQLTSHSPEQTQQLGFHLGELAQAGDIFLLCGELGSGKTCLTQGIAWGIDIKEYAFSPSFVLVRKYHGRLLLYHVDLYRLDHVEEIIDLGLEEYLFGNGICVIEWAEKGMAILPQENLCITLRYISATDRIISMEAGNEHYAQLIESLSLKEETWN